MKKMKSKIEKFGFEKDLLIKTYDEVRLENKINEIIDHLNSQDQEEEIVRSKEDMERTDYIDYPQESITQNNLEESLVVLAKDIAKENGWKEWGYRYDDKFLYVWEKCKLYSVKVPLDKLRQ